MSKMEPEEFTLDRTDKLRDDIDRKINACDAKIEQRVTYTNFHWIMGVAIAVTVTAISGCYLLLYKSAAENQLSKDRILILETKLDANKKH